MPEILDADLATFVGRLQALGLCDADGDINVALTDELEKDIRRMHVDTREVLHEVMVVSAKDEETTLAILNHEIGREGRLHQLMNAAAQRARRAAFRTLPDEAIGADGEKYSITAAAADPCVIPQQQALFADRLLLNLIDHLNRYADTEELLEVLKHIELRRQDQNGVWFWDRQELGGRLGNPPEHKVKRRIKRFEEAVADFRENLELMDIWDDLL